MPPRKSKAVSKANEQVPPTPVVVVVAPIVVDEKAKNRKLTKNEKRRIRDKETKIVTSLHQPPPTPVEDAFLDIEVEYVSAEYDASSVGSILDEFKDIFVKVA